jgi:hypothetical protein
MVCLVINQIINFKKIKKMNSNSLVSSISGFISGAIGLPTLAIVAILLMGKIIMAGYLLYYMAAISLLIVAFFFSVYIYPGYYKNPPKFLQNEKLNNFSKKFVKGFIAGLLLIFILGAIYFFNGLKTINFSSFF